MRRAENEKIIRIDIAPQEQDCTDRLERIFVKGYNEMSQQLIIAIKDCYKRLLKPSIETEFATISKEKADTEAIKTFVQNLRQLLFAAPPGQTRN